ncbi:putative glutamyl-trna amidotransferase subunit a protein [Phaeoacremonium minimum UCRPA7]|uniref:Putative glutamyl-trna amidotransferase subunit a protein n=1 Tax=Phaeoacremonium minimum (strain UCR-PA7) TaxID=1286976 RepID=R8BHM1_PHAM7|nr:putative glutamyl-trna amidotransferase subunit a protein [Phaeoacremonium minimum UCRPA7]EON98801.1 putative glutamyl-trna amidotransferase subunit a protein [Phaeoacremonium minimum UCRPA7]
MYWASLLVAIATLFLGQDIVTIAQPCGDDTTSINGTPFPPLIEATLEDLVRGLETKLFTSVDLVNVYVDRIFEVNSTLHMVTELNPDALEIAAVLDGERKCGKTRGPLHGIPILIKNNIATDDKMNNTAGSYALLGAKVPKDSTMAAKLRKAGAIILGKTNLSQWANYRSFNTSNGWSAYGGQTEGAYYPGQDPSGSSSGSGVAGSLGLALGTLGTETDGSIVSPSDVNNLVGIKPSVGLTSRYLVVPISEHQDTIGPMTRSVKDAAYILSAIVGPDAADNYTSAIPFKTMPKYEEACDFFALRGKRIGVPRALFNITGYEYLQPVIDAFDAGLDVIRGAGATVVDNVTLPGYEVLATAGFETIVLEADFVTDVAKYFSELSYNPHNITSLAELQTFTQEFPLEDWPERDTLIWESALNLTYGNEAPEFWSNYSAGQYYAGPLGIFGALKNYSLDALVVPTMFSSYLPALLGAPIVTVPLGRFPDDTEVLPNGFGNLNATAPNIPFGIAFLGARFDEYNLIGYAYAFEQRTLVRNTITPYIQPTTELADVVSKRKVRSKLI